MESTGLAAPFSDAEIATLLSYFPKLAGYPAILDAMAVCVETLTILSTPSGHVVAAQTRDGLRKIGMLYAGTTSEGQLVRVRMALSRHNAVLADYYAGAAA